MDWPANKMVQDIKWVKTDVCSEGSRCENDAKFQSKDRDILVSDIATNSIKWY